MTRLNKSYKASSESAPSAASRISKLMLQTGQEHEKLEEARRTEKDACRKQVIEADYWPTPEGPAA